MHKFYLYFLLFISIFSIPQNLVICQTSDKSHFFRSSINDFNFGNFYTGTKNFIEVSYGVGELKHKNLQTPFNSSVLSEIKLGKRYVKPIAGYKIIEFTDNYLFSSYLEDNIQSNNKISYKMWRFGFGYKKGYGYKLGNLAILPSYQLGLVWNKSNLSIPDLRTFLGNPEVLQQDRTILNYYKDGIKFGQTNIAGIDLRVSSLFGIGVSYETNVIFPYHKAWKQIGSFFIETFAQTGIDFLTEGVIIKNIPSIAPIFYFILKNGLSYYFYTLKQDNMNWPFSTATPLTMEALKINLKVTF